MPVIVRYINPENTVKNQILDFSSLPGETAVLIHNSKKEKKRIKEKIISYSEDNTNTHFWRHCNKRGKQCLC